MRLVERLAAFNTADIASSKFRAESLALHLGDDAVSFDELTEEGSTGLSCRRPIATYSQYNCARVQATTAAGLLKLLLKFFERDQSPVVALTPLGLSADAYRTLEKHGFRMEDARSLLVTDLRSWASESPRVKPRANIRIIEAASEAELKDAFEIYNSHIPIDRDSISSKYLSTLRRFENERLFLAYNRMKPVGMGVLGRYESAALLSSGIVEPSYRSHGVQSALIQARIEAARKYGSDYAFAGGVPPFSASESNLRRSGFQLLCQRLFWKRLP